ncbi:MAG TPA: hypothetical protein VHP12_06885 [Chitinophagaceae bacterium]|nr:hypothetical protein [Chitinophagaceae bacterium]
MALLSLLMLQAQKADDIINRYITAVGGEENCKKIMTINSEGYYLKKHEKMPFRVQGVHEKFERIEVTVKGKQVVKIITTAGSWTKSPLTADTLHADTDKEYRNNADDLDLQGEFIDYKSKGSSIQYLGLYEEKKNRYYMIRLTTPHHNKKIYYFDEKTNLIYKVETVTTVNGIMANAVTKYLEYQIINGVKLPCKFQYTCDQGCYTIIVMDKQEINSPIDESIFKIK